MNAPLHPPTDGGDTPTRTAEAHHVHLGALDLEPLGHPVRYMRGHRVFSIVLAIGAVLVLVAGLLFAAGQNRDTTSTGTGPGTTTATATTGSGPPGTETPQPPRVLTIRDIDLANATYRSTVCPAEYRLPGDTFTLVAGRAGSPPDLLGQPWPDNPRGVDLQSVTYGDVTGDGIEEAAVMLRCYIPNSDGISQGVTVVGLSGDHTVTLATLPDSGTSAVGTFVVVDDDRSPVRLEQRPLEYDLAQQARVVAGQLVVRWRQSSLGSDALGQGYDVTVIYRIDGSGATIVGQPTRVVVPFDPEPGPNGLGVYAIRTADLRSLTLPLAADGRDPVSGRVLPTLFDPLGPIADARLHNGTAVVTTPDGQPLDATVRIEDIRYGLIDQDPYEDAIVLVRGTAGTRSAQTAVVVLWRDGAPVISQVLGEPQNDGYTTVEARAPGYGQVSLTIDRLVNDNPDPATRTMRTYQWSPADNQLR